MGADLEELPEDSTLTSHPLAASYFRIKEPIFFRLHHVLLKPQAYFSYFSD